jgi:hypothetical protein
MGYLTGAKYQSGQLLRLLTSPCNPSAQFWIEASVPFALSVFAATVFYPDIKHVYHELTGEAILSSGVRAPLGYSKGGEGFTRSVNQLFGGGEYNFGGGASAGLRTLGTAVSIFDAFNYYAWFAAMLDEKAMDWSTLAYEMAGCLPNTSRYSIDGIWNNGACNLNVWNNPGDFSYVDPIVGPTLTGCAVYVPYGTWDAFVACSADYYYLDAAPAPTGMRIVRSDTNFIEDYDENDFDESGNLIPAAAWSYQPASNSLGYQLAAQSELQVPGPFNVAVGLTGSLAMFPNATLIDNNTPPYVPNA